MNKWFFSKRALAGVLIGAALVALLGWGHERAQSQFIADYSVYHDKAKAQEDAAYLPGTANNPLRQELNSILSRVLTNQTKDSERLTLAQQGLVRINDANTQIDAMGTAAVSVREALSILKRHANNPLYIYERSNVLALAAAGEKELATIEDIRGLSYKANFDTAEIFRRIVTDHGALTPAYTIELNSQIPQVEEQFNKRENLYAALEASTNSINRQYAHIIEGF